MDYEKLKKDEIWLIKELLQNTWLKSNRYKKELVVQVFAASENGVQPVKTVVEIESSLVND